MVSCSPPFNVELSVGDKEETIGALLLSYVNPSVFVAVFPFNEAMTSNVPAKSDAGVVQVTKVVVEDMTVHSPPLIVIDCYLPLLTSLIVSS